MRIPSLLRGFALALGISIATLTAAVVIQGIILFPRDFQALYDPNETGIRRFSLLADGQRAITLLKDLPRVLQHEPKASLYLCELAEKGNFPGSSFGCAGRRQFVRRIDVEFAPWIVRGARGAEHFFVSSHEGELFCFDSAAPAAQPRPVGIHPRRLLLVLECTRDGSIVVAGSTDGVSAWNPVAPTRLWQRSDIVALGAHFHAPTDRLYCGLSIGPCVELDRFTGATLRTFGAYSESAVSLDVSADGRYLTTLGSHGNCTVTDLDSGQGLWSQRFSIPGVGPRFSPDGQCILTGSPPGAATAYVLSTTTGELLAELRGAKTEIAGIEITTTGIVYAWDTSGTLTAWDLATRELLCQFSLTS